MKEKGVPCAVTTSMYSDYHASAKFPIIDRAEGEDKPIDLTIVSSKVKNRQTRTCTLSLAVKTVLLIRLFFG